jgi:hypothetical protein
MKRLLTCVLAVAIASAPAFSQVLKKRPSDPNSAPDPVSPSQAPSPAPSPAEQSTPPADPNSVPPDNNSVPRSAGPSPVYNLPPNVLPQGMLFLIRLDDTLDTVNLREGKHFKAKLAEDLIGPDGEVLIPTGRKIKGHVSEATTGLHSRLLLSFDQIDSGHGWIPLVATVTGVPGEHAISNVTDEGEIQRRNGGKKRAVEGAAIGGAVGGGTGAATGGGKGAGIGAGVGATVGALAGFFTAHNLRLEKGQQLEVRLDRDTRVR